MSAIIPLDGAGAKLPAYLKQREQLAQINQDVLTSGPSFPVLSIKGKVFTMVKGGEKKLLTRTVDGEEEPRPFVTLAVVRANVKARVYYDAGYVEGESDGKRPTCYSNDGITPAADAPEPQSRKCQTCPHAVWGSKPTGRPGEEEAKGTACAVNTRLAVVDPDQPATPFLLRVPAGSKKNYAEVVRLADNRGLPYTALILRVGFDPEAPSPRLTFKPIGLASDELHEKMRAMYDQTEVKEIVGLVTPQPATAEPAVETDELDAAIAAKAAVQRAATAEPPDAVTGDELAAALEPAKAPAPKPAAAAKPAPKPAPAAAKPAAKAPAPKPDVAVVEGQSELLSELNALLGGLTDDAGT